MAGTKAGSAKAYKTNIERHGKEYYKNLGRMGGSAVHKKPRGFAASGKASMAGRIGGSAVHTKPHGYAAHPEIAGKKKIINDKGETVYVKR